MMRHGATTPPENGACVGQPVEMWFPNLNVYEATLEEIRKGRKNMREALRICSTCEVKQRCLVRIVLGEARDLGRYDRN